MNEDNIKKWQCLFNNMTQHIIKSEKANYGFGEDICNIYINKVLLSQTQFLKIL